MRGRIKFARRFRGFSRINTDLVTVGAQVGVDPALPRLGGLAAGATPRQAGFCQKICWQRDCLKKKGERPCRIMEKYRKCSERKGTSCLNKASLF